MQYWMQYSASYVATTALLLSKNGHNQSQSVYFQEISWGSFPPDPPVLPRLHIHACTSDIHVAILLKILVLGQILYIMLGVFVYINRLQTWHFILKCKRHTLCHLHISIQLKAHQLSLCVHISIRVWKKLGLVLSVCKYVHTSSKQFAPTNRVFSHQSLVPQWYN